MSGSESLHARELTFDQLEVRVLPDANTLAAAAADAAAVVLRLAVQARGQAYAMFATGNSQISFLEALTARDDVDWTKVVGFHMDEYCGIAADHPACFRRYLQERLVSRVPLAAFHEIVGDAPDADAECVRYTALLREHELDLCCMGIGENGHLAFNDPPVADFDDPVDVKVVELDDASRQQQVNEGHFAAIDDVPTKAITVTIPPLLRAGAALAIVPEARKRKPVTTALTGPVSTSCPASILRTRNNATLFLDEESAAGLVDQS